MWNSISSGIRHEMSHQVLNTSVERDINLISPDLHAYCHYPKEAETNIVSNKRNLSMYIRETERNKDH